MTNEGERLSCVSEPSAPVSISFLEFRENTWLWTGPWPKLQAGGTIAANRQDIQVSVLGNKLLVVRPVQMLGCTESNPNQADGATCPSEVDKWNAVRSDKGGHLGPGWTLREP